MWPVIELPLVLLLALVGCGGPEFGNVHGTVTLDGEPLVGGTVQFQPDGGSPAFGVTDEKGHYKLDWSADQGGAPLGKHRCGSPASTNRSRESKSVCRKNLTGTRS
jgi:hypothetical protein